MPATSDHTLPPTLSTALKEWAVAVRALREGRQILLLRKGGILDAGGQFSVQTPDVLLFPTYLHEEEQAARALQPCYRAWLDDEQARKPASETVRLESAARITDVLLVQNHNALFTLSSQHIFSSSFLRFRIDNEPHKPLYALFLRAYDLPAPVTLPLEMDHYGCKSWITLREPVATTGAIPAMGDRAYAERVHVTKRLLTENL